MKNEKIVRSSLRWDPSIPEWLARESECEKLLNKVFELLGSKVLEGPKEIGLAEICEYMYPWFMDDPKGAAEYSDIYMYLCGKLLLKTKRRTKDSLRTEYREVLERGLSVKQGLLLKQLVTSIGEHRGHVDCEAFRDSEEQQRAGSIVDLT